MPGIMVIAGTVDARAIIGELVKEYSGVVATVTTDYGRELLKGYAGLEVYRGKLDGPGMESFIGERDIRCLVDASHPFAREASENALAACSARAIPYLRYERRSVEGEWGTVLKVKSFEEAAEAAGRLEGNILLTVGSNQIKLFTEAVKDYKERLFARILPDSKMMARCEAAGLTARNLIAMKGPFSVEMNVELLKYCGASILVTKESGREGGMPEKLEAAERLGVRVILVERPEVAYTNKVESIEEVLAFVRQQRGLERKK